MAPLLYISCGVDTLSRTTAYRKYDQQLKDTVIEEIIIGEC